LKCERRFTTYEKVEETARLMVVKRDGTRVPFNRENVL
jgi:transcriptional regulator NrdR family protein